jgi:type I restriction enzyme S subunit
MVQQVVLVIHLGKNDLDSILLIQPSNEILSAYKAIVEPLLKKICVSNRESRLLTQIRDALLPRLISGELQIPEEMLAS